MNDGYPTKETLQRIRTWDAAKPVELMQFIKDNWCCPYFGFRTWADEGGTNYSLSTGGWSGNEQIVSALEQNYAFWALYWLSSSRGGIFIFTVPGAKP